MWRYNYNDELYHYGVHGMKWGERRYQNRDGSLTSAGKKRYSKNIKNETNSTMKDQLAYAGRLASSVVLVYGTYKAAELCSTALVNAGFDAVEKLLK